MAAVEIDRELLRAADERAAREGVPTTAVVEHALRRYLTPEETPAAEDLAALEAFRRLQAQGPGLDEDEANRIAYEELHAYRAERAARQ
jgi:hypothetical protein